jgi:hypothetical protein
MKRDGYEPILTKSCWCLLKRRENLTDNQEVKLKELLQHNLKSARAHLLRDLFQKFWDYANPAWAEKFLDAWCTRTMRSRIGPTGAHVHPPILLRRLKTAVFSPKQLAPKNLWNFSSRPLVFYFRPDYPSKCCGRITVIHPHHVSFRKRAATDLVRDSIRQVVDWLRPVFSGSNALEEVASVSGIFPFWKTQTLRSE